MKKKTVLLLATAIVLTMLGGCGMVDAVTGAVSDKLESVRGGDDDATDKDEAKESEAKPKNEQDSADTLALLGDLMGENLGSVAGTGSSQESTEGTSADAEIDVDSPENQVVVTQADEWLGFYYGTLQVVGFGEEYENVETEFEAYALVRDPDDDYPYLEIYSDDFDIWTNVDFSYDGQALASMYVDLSDDTLEPVVYEFGDAYVVDVSLTDEEAQAFKTVSDGKTPARIRAEYSYIDPELEQDGQDCGLLMLFDLTKEPIY